MTGADAMLAAAAAAGLEVCFVNPGTTELSMVAAFERATVRPILVLHEGVASGAADGYARMTGKPALAMVHLGPSLGNAIANLHNARRAGSPMVVVVGDHPASHRAYDPPLASDIESLAAFASPFVRTVKGAATIVDDLGAVLAAARQGQVATLVVPADAQWDDATARAATPSSRSAPAGRDVTVAAEALRRTGKDGAILLGGSALSARGLRAAGGIARATGCRLVMETFPARFDGGLDAPIVERLAYIPAMARTQLGSLRALVLAGAARPITYFAERGESSEILPPALSVIDAGHDVEALAAALDASPAPPPNRTRAVRPPASAKLTAQAIVETIAALQPEGIVLVDEGVSAGGSYLRVSPHAPAHAYLSLTGGATGWGLPCAIGAAVACPSRKVVAFVGDGSAMYAVQALWTMAREALDIVTIVLSNAEYRILQLELTRRTGAVGPVGRALTELRAPRIDWLAMARSMGVAASTASSTDGFASELERCFREPGPHLIEARI